MSTALDKCEEESKRCVGRCVRAEELSKMFPTPPSMEAHAQPSPGFSLPDDAPPRDDPPPDTAIEVRDHATQTIYQFFLSMFGLDNMKLRITSLSLLG